MIEKKKRTGSVRLAVALLIGGTCLCVAVAQLAVGAPRGRALSPRSPRADKALRFDPFTLKTLSPKAKPGAPTADATALEPATPGDLSGGGPGPVAPRRSNRAMGPPIRISAPLLLIPPRPRPRSPHRPAFREPRRPSWWY